MNEIIPNDPKARPTFYAAGKNMPGYLPESEPCVTDNYEVAKEWVLDELRFAGDSALEEREVEDLSAAQQEVNRWSGEGSVCVTVGGTQIAYWINTVPAQDVQVCAKCGTAWDDSHCWACGANSSVPASDYYSA